MKHLWLVVLFMFAFVIISPVQADGPPIGLHFPLDLENKYLVSDPDPENWLRPFEITPFKDMVTVSFITAKDLRIKQSGEFVSNNIRLIAVFCVCNKHKATEGFKLVTIRIREGSGWDTVYPVKSLKGYKKDREGLL